MISLRPKSRLACFSRAKFAAAAAVLVLAGCGGSGSSGFDSAPTSEPDAIRQASEQGTCVEFKGTNYCASGVPVAIDGDSAVVDFDESSEPLPCAALPDGPACSTSVGFSPEGFPLETTYLGAWAESENGPWTLSSTESMASGGDPESDDRDVIVLLPEAGGSTPGAVVVAVLVYTGQIPPDLPPVSLHLRGFAPDFVYFTSDVAVDSSSEPGGGPPTQP